MPLGAQCVFLQKLGATIYDFLFGIGNLSFLCRCGTQGYYRRSLSWLQQHVKLIQFEYQYRTTTGYQFSEI